MFGKEQREKVPSYGARGNLHILIKINFCLVKKNGMSEITEKETCKKRKSSSLTDSDSPQWPPSQWQNFPQDSALGWKLSANHIQPESYNLIIMTQ